MCGIAGFLGPSQGQATAQATAKRMGDSLYHRGPDGGAVWSDGEAGIGFAHRRLAIVDVSDAGLQPMVSACGRWVVCYNGELYNSELLRQDLMAEGHCPAWRGHSDTEVLVEAIAHWGLSATLPRLNGMFAVAVWDRDQRQLTLLRDRLGIKPLYWGWFARTLVFGSELRALRCHPAWSGRLNRDAAASMLRFTAIQGENTIYHTVFQLAPGHCVSMRFGESDHCPVPKPFWSIPDVFAAADACPERTDEEATEALETLLRDAVDRRMMADVPLGAFLSGGIDSSLVTALMQQASSRPIQTFSIGFETADHDESHHGAAVARHLGTDHTELRVSVRDALDVVPRLAHIFDEPFADSSQIPTYLLSRLTRRHVKVALSGDGGDEGFAGYSRYVIGERLWRRIAPVPAALRQRAADLIEAVPPAAWARACRFLPKHRRPYAPADRCAKIARLLRATSLDDAHLSMATEAHAPLLDPCAPAAFQPFGGATAYSLGADSFGADSFGGGVRRMQAVDLMTYLPSDILTKVDRCTMAVSLEARVPLLDHRVVAFAAGLPLHQKIRNGQGKWLLRQVLHRHVPASLFNRPKQGFSAPLAEWLRDPFREWAEALIISPNVVDSGLFHRAHLHQLWGEHLRGTRNHTATLWASLMMIAWMDIYKPSFS